MLVAGVDGGNTKTEALIADQAGHILSFARGGPSNIHAMDPRVALAEVDRVLRTALRVAGCKRLDLCSVALSLAGADWPEDFTLIKRFARARLAPGAALHVLNDALGPLRLSSDAWVGISVICGTSNAVGARGPDGRVFHLGSWPDSAGGQELSRRALQAVFRASLELGPSTELKSAILDRFAQQDARALLHALNRRQHSIPPSQARDLAPLVLDIAADGDPVAIALVGELGATLAMQARVAAREVGLDLRGAEVVANGGLFNHRSSVMFDAVSRELPEARVIRPEGPPVAGALLLAFDAAGIAVDRTAMAAEARLAASNHERQQRPGRASPAELSSGPDRPVRSRIGGAPALARATRRSMGLAFSMLETMVKAARSAAPIR